MNSRKIFFVLGFLAVFGFLFCFGVSDAKAMTAAEIQALISSLQQQIVALQQQLKTQEVQPAAWCHDFNTNLKYGDTGSEVQALWVALDKEGFDTPEASGVFEEIMASAVVSFQTKYKSEILTPYGLKNGTGFVGKSTRAKLNALYGCGSTPTTLSITVISPNGGEKWVVGQVYNISWNVSGLSGSDKVTIQISDYGMGVDYTIIETSATSGSYSWTVPTTIVNTKVPSATKNSVGDKYKIFIGHWDSNTQKYDADDYSDNYFSIVSTTTTPSVTVTYPNGGEKFYAGNTYNIVWSATGIDRIQINLKAGNEEKIKIASDTSAIYSGNVGKYAWTVPSSIATADNYRIVIRNATNLAFLDQSDSDFSTATGTTTPATLTWSLSPDTPFSSNVTQGTKNFSFLKFYFSASNAADFTINTIRIQRMGASSNKDFDQIKLFNNAGTQIGSTYLTEELTSYPVPVPAGTAVFNNLGLKIAKGTSVTFKVAADISSTAAAGDKPYFQVYGVDASADATVNIYGSAIGNPMTIVAAAVFCDSYGDVNQDSKVDVFDSQLISQYLTGIKTLTEEQKLRADVNQDSQVTNADATMISSYIVGNVSSIPACSKKPPCSSRGDVNGNGYVNLRDANLISKYVVGSGVLTAAQKTAADVDGNGKVDVFDSMKISQYINGTISTFSVCKATTPSITVLSPNGGEKWVLGNTYNITWKANGIKKVLIQLMSEDYVASGSTIATNIDASLGTYNFHLNPSNFKATNIAKIEITSEEWIVDHFVIDYSDNYFSIVAEIPGGISCTDSDDGLDYYKKGTVTYTGQTSHIPDIAGGKTYTDVCGGNAANEFYCSNNQLQTVSYSCPFGCQNGACLPGVTVISPNGGEQLTIGSNYTINWKSAGDISTVRISLYKSGVYKDILVAETSNTGGWTWNVPSSLSPGTDYTVRVFSPLYPNNFDDSNNYFSIVSSIITVTACSDSDGGKDAYAKGLAAVGSQILNDTCNLRVFNGYNYQYNLVNSCSGADCYVDEAICDPYYSYNGVQGIGKTLVNCPSGCQNGLCAKETATICTTFSDGICPTGCAAGSDADCCKNAGKYWLQNLSGYGCYDTNYSSGCSATSQCSTTKDGCCPNWCAAGSDYDCCTNSGKCWTNNSCSDCTSPVINCTDSDNGVSYYAKGTVVYNNSGYTDSCLDPFGEHVFSGDKIVEYSCATNGLGIDISVCSNGCKDGACISSATTTALNAESQLADISKAVSQLIEQIKKATGR